MVKKLIEPLIENELNSTKQTLINLEVYPLCTIGFKIDKVLDNGHPSMKSGQAVFIKNPSITNAQLYDMLTKAMKAARNLVLLEQRGDQRPKPTLKKVN